MSGIIQGLLAGIGGPTSISYTHSDTGVLSSGSTSIPNVAIGPAASNRIVAVFLSAGLAALGRISAVTIGGVSATMAVEASSSAIRAIAIWYAVIPSGTTATVNVTVTDTTSTFNVFLLAASIYNAKSTTPVTASNYNSASGVAPSLSATLTPANGSVLFAGYSAGGAVAGTTATWTNATKQVDYLPAATFSTAATSYISVSSSLTVTATCTDTSVNSPGLAIASWS